MFAILVRFELKDQPAARPGRENQHIMRFHAKVNQYLESVRVDFLDAPSGKVF